MNQRLEDAGMVPLSPWWRATITEAFLSGVPNIVIEGGRRGGKSTSTCRVAVFQVLYGDHFVPDGDTGWFAIISAERSQAKERLDTCSTILEKLGVLHKPTADRIVITDDRPELELARRRGLRTFTASIRGVVSFTCIGGMCDEQARWRDDDSGANPAKQVLSSLTPTMATMPNAQTWNISSPWATTGVHYDMMQVGNTDTQRVFHGTTWEMNPTISEARTRELEADEISWLREYAAVAMTTDETKFFSLSAIEEARKPRPIISPADRITAGGDFAFRRDAAAVVALEARGTSYRLVYDEERRPKQGEPLRVSATIKQMAKPLESLGADSIACDLHYIESVREHLEDFEMSLLEFPSSVDGIAKAYVSFRVDLSEGKVDLSLASPQLIEQLKNTTSTAGDGATLHIKNKRTLGSHGDIVSALIAARWAAGREPPGDNLGTGARRFGRGGASVDDDAYPSDDGEVTFVAS